MWRGVASRRYRRFHPAWGSQDFGLIFNAELQSTLVPVVSAGSPTPTFTRATTAYVADWENLLKPALSGEARFTGARRVANLHTTSSELLTTGWFDNGSPTKTSSADVPVGAGITQSTKIVSNSSFSGSYQAIANATGHTYTKRVWLKGEVGGEVVGITDNGNTGGTITLTTTWTLYSKTWVTAINNSGILISDSGKTIYIAGIQTEDVSGQSNQNPSEYVSVGVLSAPYHGAGVDGIRYFPWLNGNTVASNVVSEAQGAAITSANSSALTTDAGGPFGAIADPAQTDVLGTTAAIRRTMTDAGWVSGGGGITVGAATGADGTASGAASLTAAGANGTLLFTTVLGAAVRTFGALVRRKTGTGTVNITADNGATWTAMTLTTAYKPFYFTTASAANPVVGFRVVTAVDAIEVDFNTLVAGSNKYPVFTPVNVNQAATVEQYVSASNLPTNNFTIYGESMFPAVQPAGSYYLFGTYVDANNSTQVLWDGTNLIARRRIGGVSNDATIALTPTAGTLFKWAARFSSTTGTDIFVDGSIGTNDAVTTACQIGTNFQIGADGNGANQSYATDRAKRIYSPALSASQLQAMTTP